MPNRIIQSLSDFIGGNSAVRRVADDLQLTSELILLVRMLFADGALKPAELEAFNKICREAFGFREADIPQVLEYLKDFGYETTAWDAAAMFQERDEERKKALLLHMLAIAKSDRDIAESEAELIRRTARILGLTAKDINAMRET